MYVNSGIITGCNPAMMPTITKIVKGISEMDVKQSSNRRYVRKTVPRIIVDGKMQCRDCDGWYPVDKFMSGGRFRGRCCGKCRYLRKSIAKGRQRRVWAPPIVDGKRECKKCHETKPIVQFRLQKANRITVCNQCRRETRDYYAETVARAKRDGKPIPDKSMYVVRRRLSDQEKIESAMDRLAEANAFQAWRYWIREKAPSLWMRQYYTALGKPWANPRFSDAERWRSRYKNDVEYCITYKLRMHARKQRRNDGVGDMMRIALCTGGESRRVVEILGYSIADLKRHLERQFTRGMSWVKFAEGKIHIDHIIPKSAFDMRDLEEWRTCWGLPNLRPLWAKDNIAKGDKIMFLL